MFAEAVKDEVVCGPRRLDVVILSEAAISLVGLHNRY
jgi:hypothetical protein